MIQEQRVCHSAKEQAAQALQHEFVCCWMYVRLHNNLKQVHHS
jgi:hypothetical protein